MPLPYCLLRVSKTGVCATQKITTLTINLQLESNKKLPIFLGKTHFFVAATSDGL